MPTSTILLLDVDPGAAETIRSTLADAGHQVSVTEDADDALRVAADHHLLIIDVVRGTGSAQAVCRAVRSEPALAGVPILCIAQTEDVEERVGFLEAGAHEVMARPFDPRELEARVEALLVRFQRVQAMAPVSFGGGVASRRMVTLFSPKGGVGTTTIAVNSAVALAASRPGRVALVDLDLQFGQVATHLNLRPSQTLAELCQDQQALGEPELVRTYAVRHESGLAVFCAPGHPAGADAISADGVTRVLAALRGMYDAVIVDGGSVLDARALVALDVADGVAFTIYPEIAALRALLSLLDVLAGSPAVAAKASFLLNHIFAREMLKLRDIELSLGTQVAFELPYDPAVYLKAVNAGVPVVIGAPRSAAATLLVRLAAVLVGELPAEAAADTGGRPRLLAGFRRR